MTTASQLRDPNGEPVLEGITAQSHEDLVKAGHRWRSCPQMSGSGALQFIPAVQRLSSTAAPVTFVATVCRCGAVALVPLGVI
jgi:hypothetical protein